MMCILFPDLEYQHGVLELVGLELPDLRCFKFRRLEIAWSGVPAIVF